MAQETSNSYGFFDDARREYVITRPDTPLPWLNYLGQDEFFGLCTNTAGGYTFWKDAKLRRLTRYRYNNVPYDLGGRYFYVNDGGEVWNPGWKPVKAKGVAYECRHGLGYTRIVGERDGLQVETVFFVPPGENLEVWKVTVRNTSAQRKTPKLFSYQEFCFFEALNDMTNYQRTYSIGEVEVEGSAIYHKTEYRERRNHYSLFACTHPIAGFDTARDAFVGIHEGLHEPKVPFAGACTNSLAFGWNPIGAHHPGHRLLERQVHAGTPRGAVSALPATTCQAATFGLRFFYCPVFQHHFFCTKVNTNNASATSNKVPNTIAHARNTGIW